jgi:hypothetical protein
MVIQPHTLLREDTLQMKTRAHFQGGGQRPIIELAECDHPLYHDWRGGIQVQRAFEFVHSIDGEGGPKLAT